MPEVFGKQITIERRITGSGTAAYRVFDSRGKKMNDKRGEMQARASGFRGGGFEVDCRYPSGSVGIKGIGVLYRVMDSGIMGVWINR